MKFLLLFSLFCLSAMVATAARGDRPNIIMFLIDDQNPSSIAAFGGDTYTPNLDRMAKEGMKFTRAYVSSSVCTPSRYSFLTGRFAGNSHSKLYAEAVGGKKNQGLPNFNVALERDKMNVGNVLREAGYTTGFVGKFHLTSKLDFPEFYKGKERWIDIPKNASPGPETSAQFRHNERWMRRYLKTLGFSWAKNVYPQNTPSPYSVHNPEWTTVAALEFIEQNKDGPFYLHLCSTLLHGPDKSWRKSMDHPLITGEGEVESLPEVMTPRAELLKTITEKGFDPDSHVAGEAWIDDSLGAIFRKLKELGIDDNTLVIFAPDHGRDGKASVFSHGSCQVPMIMRWPRGITAGQVCEGLVQNIDLVPTFFELGKAEKPKSYRIDGQSLTPLFKNGKAKDWRDHLYLEMGAARATVTKDWSYIAVRYTKEQIAAIKRATPRNLPKAMSYIGRLGIGVRGADRPGFFDEDQLYHLKRDPKEMKNLAYNKSQATRIKEMRYIMRKELEVIGRPFGEFIPGGNAVEPGQIDKQIEIVKQLIIKGKTVTVPEALKKDLGATDEPTPDDKAKRKAKREARRKTREEANNNQLKTDPTPKLEKENAEPPKAEPKVEAKNPEPTKTAATKLIANPIVEKAIRKQIKKPTSELTKVDLEKVTELNFALAGTKITDAVLKEVAKCKQLISLNFNEGQITAEGLKEVAKLQKLKTLGLSSTGVTDVGLKEVAKCTQLTYLNLMNTKITDAGLKEVVKLKKLNDLTLAYNKITGASLKELAKMNQLRHLWLDGTKVTKVDVTELKKALPKCRITGP